MVLAFLLLISIGVVETLPPHLSESSAVTRRELRQTETWLDAVMRPATGAAGGKWRSTALPFSFMLGGTPSSELIRRIAVETREAESSRAVTRDLSWSDPETGLRLSWRVKRFRDYPAVEWMLHFENTGSRDTPVIGNVQPLDLTLLAQSRDPVFWVHGVNGARNRRDDLAPFTLRLPSEDARRRSVITLGGVTQTLRSSERHLPFFALETPEARGLIAAVGWSGTWLARIGLEVNRLRVTAGLDRTSFVLHPGESARSPRILVLFWEGARLHGQNMFRQLLRTHYLPALRGAPPVPRVTANSAFMYHGGGLFFDVTEANLLPLIEPLLKLGVEMFVIDLGWSVHHTPGKAALGDWRPDPKRFPNGFRALAGALRKGKADFGLWFQCEKVDLNTPLASAHSEWLARHPEPDRRTLRFGHERARDWFLGRVETLVRDQSMTCYRQDGYGWFEDEWARRVGMSQMEHLTGLYETWRTLRRRHPELIMEGCSGGGRRIDLETVSNFHWNQKSDRWFDSDSDQVGSYGGNLFLPGGWLNLPTEATDDYGAWSSFGGQLCLAWHPLDGDFPMERARRQVALYKRIRPLLSGDFYPLTPCSLDGTWMGYQFHQRETDRGFALIFRRHGNEAALYGSGPAFPLRLRGLDPERHYELAFQAGKRSERIAGARLASGLEVAMPASRSAEMVMYERTR